MAFWRNRCESLSVSRNLKSISFSYLWFITIINWGSKFFWLVWSSTHRVLTHHLHSQLHTSRRFDPWWRMRMDVLLNLPSSLGNVSIWRTDSWLMIRILVETFWDLNVEMVHFFEVWRGEAHTRNVQTLTVHLHAWNIYKANGSVLSVTIWCVTWVSVQIVEVGEYVVAVAGLRMAYISGGPPESWTTFESLGCDSAHTWYTRGIYCQLDDYMICYVHLPTTFCKNLKNLLKSVLPWAADLLTGCGFVWLQSLQTQIKVPAVSWNERWVQILKHQKQCLEFKQ